MNSKSIYCNIRALTLSLCLGVSGFSIANVQAIDLAEGGGRVNAEEFQVRLAANEKKLVKIEGVFERLESSKVITLQDFDELNKSMSEYAEEMKLAIDNALNEAEKASQGKGGDANLLVDFERTAKAHEARTQQLEALAQRIDMKLKAGTIKLDKASLQKMTLQERREFKLNLLPEGVKESEELNPERFRGSPSGAAIKPKGLAAPAGGEYAAQGWCCEALLESMGNLLVSPAHAEIVAQLVTDHLNAVVKAQTNSAAALNSYRKCLNSCRWFQIFCKTRCLALYIKRLA